MSLTNLKNLLGIIAVLFFTVGALHAEEKKHDNRINEFFEHVEKTFKKEGGSAEGLALLQKSMANAKDIMGNVQGEMKPLTEQLEKIMTASKFDEKAFMETQTKINNAVVKSMNERDKATVALLKELNAKDRSILAKIFSKAHSQM
ncbi:MAG: hypothetical protein FWE18_04610 [Alphaproteobacteria bacterium]|nr:hypothetical protein [Alphaproteobacteria bacterium]